MKSRTEIINERFGKFFHYLLIFIFCQGGALLTWTFQNVLNLNNVLSAGISTLTLITVSTTYGPATLCASFAGMSTLTVIPSAYWATLMAFIATIFYSILIDNFNLFSGYGGRLGVVAWMSVSLVIPILLFSGVEGDYKLTFWAPHRYESLDLIFGCVAVLSTTVSSFVSIASRELIPNMKQNIPTFCVWAILASAFVLPFDYKMEDDLLIFIFIGLSVGITTKEVMQGYTGYIVAGFISGLLGLAFFGLSTGESGGKVGVTAFSSVFIYTKIILPLVKCRFCRKPTEDFATWIVLERNKSLEQPMLTTEENGGPFPSKVSLDSQYGTTDQSYGTTDQTSVLIEQSTSSYGLMIDNQNNDSKFV